MADKIDIGFLFSMFALAFNILVFLYIREKNKDEL